ncbi:MAG: hypothetical protein IAF08_12250 [Rhizobacter sp.]|nr:hypothetical protein [Chlorobiales bacterium]
MTQKTFFRNLAGLLTAFLLHTATSAAQPAPPEQTMMSLRQSIATAPNDSLKGLLYARVSEQFVYRSYKDAENEAFRKPLLLQALVAVDSALMFSKHPSIRAVRSIVVLDLARYAPKGEAIVAVNVQKKELEDILRVDTTNPEASITYGILAYDVTAISGMQRFVAGLLFGKLPDDLTYQTALLNLLQAKVQGAGDMPILYFKLAETYFALKNNRDAIASLETCIALPEKRPYIDAYFKGLAKKLLDDYRSKAAVK